MPNEFNELRNLAIQKRDKAIADAHAAYEVMLKRIAELEQDIVGKGPSKEKSLSACIDSIIPSNRTFTVPDLCMALSARYPGRAWRNRTVIVRVTALKARGIIRRIRRGRQRTPAVYARVGVEVEQNQFDDMSLSDAIAHVMGSKAMNGIEIAVALLEADYPTSMPVQRLAIAIRTELREKRERFKRTGERWSCR